MPISSCFPSLWLITLAFDAHTAPSDLIANFSFVDGLDHQSQRLLIVVHDMSNNTTTHTVLLMLTASPVIIVFFFYIERLSFL
jgi:hypothetical protein